MTAEEEEQVKKLMNEIECPSDFNCYKTGFTSIHKILKDMQCLESYVATSEQPPPLECIYSLSFGYNYFCRCPLAVYIIKHKIQI